MVKVVLGVLGACLGTNTFPKNIWQSYVWFHRFIPGDGKFHTTLLAAISWSRTIHNKVTFDGYVYTMASFKHIGQVCTMTMK